MLNQRVRRRMPWYTTDDLIAEAGTVLRCVARRCDVVHYFDGEHSAQYLPLMTRRRRLASARTLATFHQPPALLERLVDRRVAECLDEIVVVSPTQRAFFESFIDPARVRVIHLGVDTDFFRPAEGERAPGPFRCITVGHWLRDWSAMSALARLLLERGEDVELHVVTDRETGLEGMPNVRRHRSVTDARLLELYQQSDALLLPLTDATANNSLLEGMACGLPVIATKLPAVEAYVQHCEPVLAESNDSEQLLAAIKSLPEDDGIRERVGLMSRAAAEHFSWKRTACSYIDLYSEVRN